MSALARHPRHVESIERKADRLIDTGRCHELQSIPGLLWVGVVEGDTGRHLVTEVADDLTRRFSASSGLPVATRSCSACEGFAADGMCSHVHAAFLLRLRSESVDVVFASLA